MVAEVSAIASGVHEERPKRKQLLTDARVGVLVVEHRDRLTRVGSGSRMTLLEWSSRAGASTRFFRPDRDGR